MIDFEEGEGDIGVPLLQNKTAIIISLTNTLHTIANQIKLFGMNISSISDKFAAIGHIVVHNNQVKILILLF